MTSRTPIRLLAGAAVALVLPLLAGCQAFGINEQYDALYANLDEAQGSWDSARIPRLVPDDAERVRIGYNTIDVGAILAFTSEGGIVADYCEPAEIEGVPAFEPGWWPEADLPEEGFTCGDWTVVEVDGEFLVWD